MKLIIFTDGASRGNPGHASYGFTISDEKGSPIHQKGKYIGVATNNIAEYTAVLEALKWVKKNVRGVPDIKILADSKLIVEQLSGRFKIKNPGLKVLFNQIKILELEIGNISFKHIPRIQNYRADKLANQALDNLKLQF